jgi:geranylgeranyl pyrophosphate synthase
LEKKHLLKVAFFEPVQGLIQQVEELMLSQAENSHPQLALALEHLLSSGGKRIRVAITLLTGEILGGSQDAMVTLSASLELLHTATLVHDDLIDGSLIRRGIPTLNAQWSSPATVLTGDFIFARAAKLAADVNLIPVMQLFAQTLAIIVNGEIKQLFGRRGIAGREEYQARIYAKTASLFETASKSAAIVSGAPDEVVEKMRLFGYRIGMAFQIVDDILDFTGNQSVVGKPVANDLRQGVITLPVIYYIEQFPDDLLVKTLIQNGSLEENDLELLIQRIRRSGSIDKAMEEATGYVERSVAILLEFPQSPARQSLEDLARFIVQRTN